MRDFGKLKTIFNNILIEGIVSKKTKNKEIFKEYIKEIKKDKILRDQFLVYTNIENMSETNEQKAIEFVKTNIEILKKYNKKDILESNKKLVDKFPFKEYDNFYNDELKELHENINTLIFISDLPKNVDKKVDSLSKIVEYIKTNQKKERVDEDITLPLSLLTNIAVDKFNEKYSSLNENEKKALKSIIESDDNQKKDIFINLVKECVVLVNEHLKRANTETKEKLLDTKDKLLNMEFIEESFITDVSKLLELKSDLNG